MLGELSWKFVRETAKFEPHRLPAPGDADAMKEEIAQWVGRVWSHTHELPQDDDLASFDILSLECEFRSYIEANGPSLFDRGQSVEEIWCATKLFLRKPVTVYLSDRFSEAASARVTSKQVESAEMLVWILAALSCGLSITSPTINVLVTDGSAGHTLALAGLNPVTYPHPRGVSARRGWFTFHDPWPARSLLAFEKGYGAAAAYEDIARPPFWLLSPEDLADVLVGFMLPTEFQKDIDDLTNITRMLTDERSSDRKPIWYETPGSDELFPVLSLSHGGQFGAEASALLGLARWALMRGEVDEAEARFEAACEIDPMEAAIAANQLYRAFGRQQLAQAWYERLFGRR